MSPVPCARSRSRSARRVEVGHIFKLGTTYSEKLGAEVLDDNGKSVPVVMGSYGIGVGRCAAAIVERHHDENGIIWPTNVAPFEVVVTVLNPKDVATLEAGTRLYETLGGDGVDVLLDDRDERPGVKFKDAELVGIPCRITVGPKGLKNGVVEIFRRSGGEKREVDVNRAAEIILNHVLEERR